MDGVQVVFGVFGEGVGAAHQTAQSRPQRAKPTLNVASCSLFFAAATATSPGWTRTALAAQNIAMIAPHRRGRRKPKTQDGRVLRRYRRRWKVERLFAWLQNERRILTRHERQAENYLGFVHLGCIKILLRRYL